MKMPRFEIGWLMAFIVIIAFNLCFIRSPPYTPMNDHDNGHRMVAIVLGALPMADILAICILAIRQSQKYRPFLHGFVVYGAFAWSAYIALVYYYCEETIVPTAFWLQRPVQNILGQSYAFIPVQVITTTFLLIWPQLAFALAGGYLTRRLANRRMIEAILTPA